MSKKLFVGNLPYAMKDSELKELFANIGDVEEAKIIIDRETGKSRGFGFVTMASDTAAEKAIIDLNGTNVGGRKIMVNEAREKNNQPRYNNHQQ